MSITVRITKANTRIRRSFPKDQQLAISRHARHVGEVMFAWNELQGSLFGVFCAMIGDASKYRTAHAIWHTIQSDKTQREMLMNVAREHAAKGSALFEAIKWVTDCAGELSPFRNDAAHTPMWIAHMYDGKAVYPNFIAGRRPASERLAKVPLAKTWRAVRGDLRALTHYAGLIAIQMTSPEAMPRTFPARPRLQVVQEKTPKGNRALRLQGGGKRQPQPKS